MGGDAGIAGGDDDVAQLTAAPQLVDSGHQARGVVHRGVVQGRVHPLWGKNVHTTLSVRLRQRESVRERERECACVCVCVCVCVRELSLIHI